MDLAFRALADPRRREIVRLVWADELASTAIASHFTDISRPAVSQHLGVLRNAGLLHERREGTRRLYCANHVAIQSLRDYLDGYWADSLGSLRDLVEKSAPKPRRQ